MWSNVPAAWTALVTWVNNQAVKSWHNQVFGVLRPHAHNISQPAGWWYVPSLPTNWWTGTATESFHVGNPLRLLQLDENSVKPAVQNRFCWTIYGDCQGNFGRILLWREHGGWFQPLKHPGPIVFEDHQKIDTHQVGNPIFSDCQSHFPLYFPFYKGVGKYQLPPFFWATNTKYQAPAMETSEVVLLPVHCTWPKVASAKSVFGIGEFRKWEGKTKKIHALF